MKSIAKTLILITFFLIQSGPARAFTVSPLTLDLDARPGQSYVGELLVTGNDIAPEPVRVYQLDWDRQPDGTYVSNNAGSLARSCAAWLTVGPTQFDAPARDRMLVKYSFTVPEDATGTYWTFIMLEGVSAPVKPSDQEENRQVFIGARLRFAVRFAVHVDSGKVSSGAISGLEIVRATKAKQGEEPALKGKALFSNTGNTALRPTGFFEIRDLDGNTISQIPADEFYAFPGRDLWVEFPLDAAPASGSYLALAVFDYGGDSLVAGEKQFDLPLPEEVGEPAQ